MKHIYIYLLILLLMGGCKQDIGVYNFKLIKNSLKNETLITEVPLNNVIENGVVLPSQNEYFHFSFNILKSKETLFYKIYYQNESYKHPEFIVNNKMQTHENPNAKENFYGSWKEVNIGFKSIPKGTSIVFDSLQIVGNPRDESKFYDIPNLNKPYTQEALKPAIATIKSNPIWMEQIKEKAKKHKRNINKQIRYDAIWLKNEERKKDTINHRWRRNPRMGYYSFMLVVTNKEGLHNIPKHIQNINFKNDISHDFSNPFYFFNHQTRSFYDNVEIVHLKNKIKAKTTFKPEKGIYVNPKETTVDNSHCPNLPPSCNHSLQQYHNAHFIQYSHAAVSGFEPNNIAIQQNILDDTYNTDAYKYDLQKAGRVKIKIDKPMCDCQSISQNAKEASILLKNPGNNSNSFVKENVGIGGRIGFTYGTYTAKIKFPKLLNKHGIWNGLTAAFWLLNQSDDPWNYRTGCEREFISKNSKQRHKELAYSEIDIEIVKASPYWPCSSYDHPELYPVGLGKKNEIIVAATNWDMDCKSPSKYSIGYRSMSFDSLLFGYHRWDTDYPALTSKNVFEHDDILGKVLYYQIEWSPYKIVWRLGANKENLHTFCIMDSTITNIPNNQMTPIISQEFHNTKWWAPTPFKQEDIPFPLDEITGEVFEITVE